jgi:DNA gyrase subunit A
MGRNAAGVRGIRLVDETDRVVGMVCVNREEANLLVVSEKGYGKRSLIDHYRITKRGGKGVKTINVTEKTGNLVAIKEVVDGDDLMIINKSGITIRISVESMRVMGRATQGVKLIRLNEGDAISSVEKIINVGSPDDIEEITPEIEGGDNEPTN